MDGDDGNADGVADEPDERVAVLNDQEGDLDAVKITRVPAPPLSDSEEDISASDDDTDDDVDDAAGVGREECHL